MVNDSILFRSGLRHTSPQAGEGERLLSGDNEEVKVVMTCHIMAHVGPSNRGTVRELQCKKLISCKSMF